MKEKLQGLLGAFGIVLYYIITVILAFAPLIALDFNFFIDFIIIAIVTLVPIVGSILQLVLWVWSFTVVVHWPFDIVTVIYYVAALVYIFSTLVPFVLSLIRVKRGR